MNAFLNEYKKSLEANGFWFSLKKARALIALQSAFPSEHNAGFEPVDIIANRHEVLIKWQPRSQEASIVMEDSEKSLSKQEKLQIVANRIRVAMRTRGMRGYDLATLMNVKQSAVSRWLSGENNFTIDTLIDIEEKLGIELINYSEL